MGAAAGLQLDLGEGLNTAGAQISARTQEALGGIGAFWGQLSARANHQVSKIGSELNKLGESVPTENNKRLKAARTIQKAWRACAARGHFHEERGAVLMLQSAARRKKALAVRRCVKRIMKQII